MEKRHQLLFSIETLANARMKLIVQVKLPPTPQQANTLHRTLETANAACNAISRQAWENQIFRQFALHKLTYRGCAILRLFPCRPRFSISEIGFCAKSPKRV